MCNRTLSFCHGHIIKMLKLTQKKIERNKNWCIVRDLTWKFARHFCDHFYNKQLKIALNQSRSKNVRKKLDGKFSVALTYCNQWPAHITYTVHSLIEISDGFQFWVLARYHFNMRHKRQLSPICMSFLLFFFARKHFTMKIGAENHGKKKLETDTTNSIHWVEESVTKILMRLRALWQTVNI